MNVFLGPWSHASDITPIAAIQAGSAPTRGSGCQVPKPGPAGSPRAL